MEKINIAEILRNCPKGMELDCAIYDNVEFDYVEQSPESKYPIHCLMKTNDGYNTMVFTNNGCNDRHPNAKCVIFPKGKTTWEGFQRPFKDGDIITCTNGICTFVAIYKDMYDEHSFNRYVCLTLNERMRFSPNTTYSDFTYPRLATEEEKQKLFDAIKANGYKWNPETKTLEKLIEPKFKVGDRITDKKKFIYRITEITNKGYKLHDLKTTFITFEEADRYFVKVVDIFDINTLIPFESRVLVRSSYGDIWRPAIYGVIDSKKHYHYVVGGNYWTQCIPFEPNKELLGTTNDCDEYYKTWK